MKTLDDFLREEVANPPQRITLRPFQEEAYRSWELNSHRGTVIAPTGTGKTVIAGYAIKQTKAPTLIITPTERILKMWMERLREKFGIDATAYYGNSKKLSPVTVTIYNTAAMHHPEIISRFSLIILDEVHHAGSEAFSRILEMINGDHKVMALTATLKREDERHTLILTKLPVVYYLDLKKAIQEGLVAPIEVIPEGVEMNELEKMRYAEICRRIDSLRRGMAVEEDEGERRRLEAEARKLINVRRVLLSNLEAKRERLLEIARRHSGDRLLVFSESIASIERIKRYLSLRGVSAETYHSRKAEAERDRIFSEWGRGFQVLLTCRALDEGVDVPEAGVGVIIASGMSVRQLVQRQGRLMRRREGKVARLYVIYARGSVEQAIPAKIRTILEGKLRLY